MLTIQIHESVASNISSIIICSRNWKMQTDYDNLLIVYYMEEEHFIDLETLHPSHVFFKSFIRPYSILHRPCSYPPSVSFAFWLVLDLLELDLRME